MFTHTFHNNKVLSLRVIPIKSHTFFKFLDDDDTPTYTKSFDSSNGYFVLVAGNVLPSRGNYRVAIYSFGYEKKNDEIEIIIASTDTDYKKRDRVILSGTRVQNVDFEVRI